MATAVSESVVVRRPRSEVGPVASDPEAVLPLIAGFGRFELLGKEPDGSQTWDMFLDVGTIHIGGRVVVEPNEDSGLSWHAVRGTRHTVELSVEGDDERSTIHLTMRLELANGLVAGRIAELVARGIMRRHLQAALEQLRHHLEHVAR